MWYNIDFNKLTWDLLKVTLRKPQITSYIWSLVEPIKTLHVNWKKYREDNIYKLEHTAQVCYFEAALNDRFDSALRRIYINDTDLYDTVYVYTEAEQQNEPHVYTEAESDTLWVYTEAETADTGVDFTVFVPADIMLTQSYEVNALINFYRLAGKRYLIQTI